MKKPTGYYELIEKLIAMIATLPPRERAVVLIVMTAGVLSLTSPWSDVILGLVQR
ncbi:hypothetical protein [Variovorax sp. J31P207]|uniref:hypothetical protein n=1 Tax=Variovorax sp. J31P207 TaxID=3053510 RepID=UPI002575C859|nr:hypothetical protein [Variovorax sp. J31P207]MDM0071630.1 hypothetical protein [Variovorax sp. J31P207]